MLTATPGTKLAAGLNAAMVAIGALGAIDWISLIGPTGGTVLMIVGILNTILHSVTGNIPLLGKK